MDIIDAVVAPFYFIIFYMTVYFYRSNKRHDFLIRTYLMKGFLLRLMGGVAFACVYFFYYNGGDTLNYFADSVVISDALVNDPYIGLQMLFSKINYANPDIYSYRNQMIFQSDQASHFISRIAAVINLFTFDSFLATTLFFSLLGFIGNWYLFRTFCKLYPSLHKELSIGCLYLPSIIFWTSGIMKDTLCTLALCILFKLIVDIFVFNKSWYKRVFVMFICLWVLLSLKVYILLCFIPTVSIYINSIISNKIANPSIRKLFQPIFLITAVLVSYYTMDAISSNDRKYNLYAIQETALVTANYIGKVSLQSGGSYYSLGDLDFSPSNIPLLAIKAFNVTLYRPYIWEANNLFMVLSVLESLYFIYLTFLLIVWILKNMRSGINFFTPFTSFCFLFAFTFSFVVGVTSSNFGTLARYKSLMLPFFVCGVYVTIKQNSVSPRSNQFIQKDTK
jgi:hypothetical protein